MNAAMRSLYGRSSREILGELVTAVDALPPAVVGADQLAADCDPAALERLERIAERCSGLSRLALQARAALANELRGPEAA